MLFVYSAGSTVTVKLSSSIDKSGRQAVCHDETIVYSCLTSHVLTWNIYHPDGSRPAGQSTTFLAGDRNQFVNQGQYFAYLQNNTAMNLLSQLILPFTPKWNGIRIQCMSGNNGSENLFYATAGNYITL